NSSLLARIRPIPARSVLFCEIRAASAQTRHARPGRRDKLAAIPHSGTFTQCRTYRTRRPMSDAHIPDKPALEGLESKWDGVWAAQGTYLFDRLRAAEAGRAGV